MIKKVLLCLTMIFLLTGCGDLETDKVTKKYVQNKIETSLTRGYGTKFEVNITSFDKNSEKREATATVYPKNDPSLKFKVTGSIEDDYFKGSRTGSSYHLNHDFGKILWEKVNNELAKKNYSFEIGGNADYKKVAENVRDYIKQQRILLDDYKTGSNIEIYFHENIRRADIPLTINGSEIDRYSKHIIIDDRNGLTIVDTSAGEYGWIGALELEDYLRYLANGQLENIVCEIRCHNYRSPYCTC